jgi:hypothetical protein
MDGTGRGLDFVVKLRMTGVLKWGVPFLAVILINRLLREPRCATGARWW